MKITSIKQQLKQSGRYSIFVDNEYSFSLSEGALVETKLANGQELSKQQIGEYKKLSDEDKLYNRTLRYVAMRAKSKWEISSYLERKGASPPLIEIILNKLSIIDLINDEKYAKAFVENRRLLRPTSTRKMILELRKKRIPAEIIDRAVKAESADEMTALQATIVSKRRQTKYQDDQKLMQYLARQGYNYGDIKDALSAAE